MQPVDDAGDDDDVAERDGLEVAARRAGGIPERPASAADEESLWRTRTARRAAGFGSATTVTTDRGGSGRCSRTTQAFDNCPARTFARTPMARPSWETGGRCAAGRGIASTTMAGNTVPNHRGHRCRDQSLPR